MSKKLTKEKFIERSNIIHNNLYDYSLVEYINSSIKVKIICLTHDMIFEQTPNSHLNGRGCPLCYGTHKHTNDDFIKLSIKIHNDKYDYSLVNYINNKTSVKILCRLHNIIFKQTPNAHLKGQGCPLCGKIKKRISKTKTNDKIIEEFKKIHNNKYNYSLVNYVNNRTKVKIICPIHKVFEQQPHHHLNGVGCPKCNSSKGEIKVKNFLNNNNLEFEEQKKFEKCKYKRKLKFDFYLPKNNICIEFDGEQHFKKYRFEKNDDKLFFRQKLDKIKTEYCLNNNIQLIRIRYDENIDEKLKFILTL